MPRYVDGYIVPVPKKNLKAYRKIAVQAGKVWKKHGALHYVEAVADDLSGTMVPSFTSQIKIKAGETLFFSFVIFKSRAHRDRVNALAMKDPKLMEGLNPKKMPFDCTRMIYSGFKAMVDL